MLTLATGPVTTAAAAAPVPLCDTYAGLPEGDGPIAGLVWPAGDTFTMGDDDERSEARAAHEVMVGGFWIDRHEVTNAQCARFVAATGYVMLAERGLDPTDHPGMPSELLMPRSTVFFLLERIANLADVSQWWRHVPGAAPDAAPRRVINGGLWLCTPYFCATGRPRPKRWMSILVVPT